MLRCWVEVSLDRIAANYRAIKQVVGGVEVMPVVKADAYRHGAVAVSHCLEEEGVRWLAVSNVEEGVRLRENGVRARILVMADTVEAGGDAWRIHRLTPVVHSLDEIRVLPKKLPYHLKVDTGMGRLGVRATPQQIIKATGGTNLEGLMTHFASSADYTSGQTGDQAAAFAELARRMDPPWIHASSTNPIHFGRRDAWGNLVRPGLSIYGYVPTGRGPVPERLLEVAPALEWKARVLLVKQVETGARVGYGGLAVTSRPTRVAIVGAGYADGLPHRLSNRGAVLARGRQLPILGAVSMDVTTVDATECPKLRAGDTVTLLGRDGEASIDAQQMAKTAGTLAYGVLCGISARVRHVFV